ncbi:hypothetical protein GF380_01705 [Candidatus Uhrbacteria bacterium]|nr:hypothetical protein [Candidatus Uhrbacteria bacterium]MBD3283978.1 hypothetical protein [Candidatus Uhrbacteria bacterium]
MNVNELPPMNLDTSETGCCPRFHPEHWQHQTIQFDQKPFVRANTFNLMHIPLNMGSVIKKTWDAVKKADADTKDSYLILSRDPSPWVGEHNFAVTKEVEGLANVKLTGTYFTKVFEGPYQNAGKWIEELKTAVKEQGSEAKEIYFFYTTCPNCIKKLGKNYVIGFAQIA